MKNIRTVLICVVAVLVVLDVVLFVNYCSKSQKVQEAVPASTAAATRFAEAEPTAAPTVIPEQSQAPEATVAPTAEPLAGALAGKTICLDAGHGNTDKSGTEAVSPDSSEEKAAHVSGADSEYISEEQFNLKVALKTQELLQSEGAVVTMTRTTSECDLSNIDRAELGNEADIMVRIHADSSESSSAYGMSMLVPVRNYFGNPQMVEESVRLGNAILENAVSKTGARDRGIVERSDMTGFNWSKVPVCLIECGFLSNSSEAQKLADETYQSQIAKGIADGIKEYFGV